MIRSLTALGYVVARGVRGMGQTPLVQMIAVSTMAVCLLLLGAVVLVWSNANGVVRGWGVDVPITAYLDDDATELDVQDLTTRVETLPEVEAAVHVSSEESLERLAEGLGSDDEGLLEGIDADVLPASLEIYLQPDTPVGFGPALAERVRDDDGVSEVAVAGAWVGQVHSMLDTLQLLAIGAGILVSFACMAVVWSTIRLGVT